jgi:hypothetical protein
MFKNVIQGVVWILKRLLSSFKDTHQLKNNEEREGKKGMSLRQPVEETKKEKRKKKRGSLFFWGKSMGRPEKKQHSGLVQPRKFENYKLELFKLMI